MECTKCITFQQQHRYCVTCLENSHRACHRGHQALYGMGKKSDQNRRIECPKCITLSALLTHEAVMSPEPFLRWNKGLSDHKEILNSRFASGMMKRRIFFTQHVRYFPWCLSVCPAIVEEGANCSCTYWCTAPPIIPVHTAPHPTGPSTHFIFPAVAPPLLTLPTAPTPPFIAPTPSLDQPTLTLHPSTHDTTHCTLSQHCPLHSASHAAQSEWFGTLGLENSHCSSFVPCFHVWNLNQMVPSRVVCRNNSPVQQMVRFPGSFVQFTA